MQKLHREKGFGIKTQNETLKIWANWAVFDLIWAVLNDFNKTVQNRYKIIFFS